VSSHGHPDNDQCDVATPAGVACSFVEDDEDRCVFAVGCYRLPIGLFEPFSALSDLRPVATGCARSAP
jgi:preprotein translocase subunit Sec63